MSEVDASGTNEASVADVLPIVNGHAEAIVPEMAVPVESEMLEASSVPEVTGPDAPTTESPTPAAPTTTPIPQPSPTSEPPTVPTSLAGYYLKLANDTIFNRKRAKLERVVAETKTLGSITNDRVEKLLHVSDSTAQRYLMQLVKEGRLKRSGATILTTYEAI